MNIRKHFQHLLVGLVLFVPASHAGQKDKSISATRLGTYSTGLFSDETSAAEIVAHDSRSQRLFVVNGTQARIDVVDVRNPAQPNLLFSIDCTPYGAQPNSVAVHGGVVAVAVEAAPKTDPGKAVFFDVDGRFLAAVVVGALPDMICFTPNGKDALVANEGEPNDAYTIDPEGSVSIIDLRGGARRLKQGDVRTVGFQSLNNTVLDPSVRVFGPGATVAQDLEPEYIAISEDSRRAYVTLQEANAIAIIDIKSATLLGVRGLGFKDHARVDALADLFPFDPAELPSIGTTAAGQTLQLGGFSGLFFEGIDPVSGRYKFITNTDRGPNGEPTGLLRPFLLPDFAPEVVRFELDRGTGDIAVTERIPLRDAAGQPLTGLPNLAVAGGNASTPHNDEIGVDLFGNVLANDPLGGDFEGIVIDPADGSMWLCDEYRPAIYHFNATGILIERYVPVGAGAAAGMAAGTFGTEVLPAVLAQRRQNRGFEAIALNDGKIYAFVQSPARNPATTSNGTLNTLKNVRLVELDPATNATRQFIYILDNPNDPALGTRPDKVGDAVAIGAGDFLVIERDDDNAPANTPEQIEKKIYRFSIVDATDVSGMDGPIGATGKTVDQLSLEEMLDNNITPLAKYLHVDLNVAGYNTVQKVEGLAYLDSFTLGVINDNDFQVAGIAIDQTTGTFTLNPDYTPEPVVLGLIDLATNALDASNSDGAIRIRPWPVKGMYLPDGIAGFKVKGKQYYITANEGDSRDYDGYSEEERVRDLDLDAAAFPYRGTLQRNGELGRLKVTSAMGDTDLDGDFDELYSFGARSFTIWNESVGQVYDSGDALEQLIASDPVFSALFNADNADNEADDRSDDKGPEPESVVVGKIGGETYAFVGLERIGGVMIFDVSDPSAPKFVQYFNNRDPGVEPGANNGSDYGPEGLLFIEKQDSPIHCPLLVVANEVSGTTTIYKLE